MPRPGHALALVASIVLAGCAALGVEEDCGPQRTINLPRNEFWPLVNIFQEDDSRVFQWSVTADLACHEEHISYTANAELAAKTPAGCPEGEPTALVKEQGGPGQNGYVVVPEPLDGDTIVLKRSGELGLKQFGAPQFFSIYFDIHLPAQTSEECARQRISHVGVAATYREPKGADAPEE